MDFSEMGKRIRKKRRAKSMTQEALAEKVGVTSAYIGMIERGERAPSLEFFVMLTNALDVTADELLNGLVKECRNVRLASYASKLSTMKNADVEKLFRIMDVYLNIDAE